MGKTDGWMDGEIAALLYAPPLPYGSIHNNYSVKWSKMTLKASSANGVATEIAAVCNHINKSSKPLMLSRHNKYSTN